MHIYDKAQWHIDGGEPKEEVVLKFKIIFDFLNKHNMLSGEGKELLEIGIDSSISLNEKTVTKEGALFLSETYESILSLSSNELQEKLAKQNIL